MNSTKLVRVILSRLFMIIVVSSFGTSMIKADWPAHRGDQQRTGYREQPLQSKYWTPLWRLDALSPPTPAWPDPARGSLWQKLDHIEARVTDDQGDVPLIVNDVNSQSHVLVTSSANDQLVAIDPLTGKLQWQFFVRAPIRYAPSVVNGIAFVGADDGVVRAIDIATGQQLWQSQIGPDLPWIVGNNRLISAYPIRTSVLADRGLVYATAGLFPSQGVYAFALDAKSGKTVWRRKITQSPQGYLLTDNADNGKIYIPTGRAQPFAVAKANGKFLFNLPSPGGSFCMLTAEAFFAGTGNKGTIQAKPNNPAAKMLSFQGRQVAAGGGRIWTANGAKLASHDMQAVAKVAPSPLWSVDCELDQSLIVSGEKQEKILFVAGDSDIHLFHAEDGKLMGELSLDDPKEEIKYLAVSRLNTGQSQVDEILIASTKSGKIFAWKGTLQSRTKPWPATKKRTQDGIPHLMTEGERTRVAKLKSELKSPHGLALVLEDNNGGLTEALLNETKMRVMLFVSTDTEAERLRLEFHQRGWYGHRVSVWHWEENKDLPFSKRIFNVLLEANATTRSTESLLEMVTPGDGMIWRHQANKPEHAPKLEAAGTWRHQYADPTNQADSFDAIVGNAAGFRLLWFGGVGPSQMPDRHLRGPAPLSAAGNMVMQGDGVLIGIDPANGTERWQLPMPDHAMRYVTPYDAGYACLTEDGEQLFIAADQEIWQIDAYTGEISQRLSLNERNRAVEPSEDDSNKASNKMQWGYLAESNQNIFATKMKSTAARTDRERKTQYTYVNSDYRSNRPLVTSRELHCLNHAGQPQWAFAARGVIIHGSIAIGKDRMVFVEARSRACSEHPTDRIALPLLMQDSHLVCVDTRNGKTAWEQPLKWPESRNMLYTQLSDQNVILTTSESGKSKATYSIRVVSLTDGSKLWEAKHLHIRNGLFHGEQVHHPVVLHRPKGSTVLVAEPYLYELKTGKRIVPDGAKPNWALRRPGHSCGTLSGAGHCLFFRAANPTVFNMGIADGGSFTALSPTRPGCWINMIPAGGRLLIPEGSASCVCNYSLQTSMGFAPIPASEIEKSFPILADILPK